MAIGMSVPGLSVAGLSLGLGDASETEEERRKRLMAIQQTQQRLLPSSALSPAGSLVFGNA